MIIGCPKEIKNHEYRVAVTPSMVRLFIEAGHTVLIETKAGLAIGFKDSDYQAQGALIAETAAEVWQADLVVKVKEPQPQEFKFLREGQILFGYLHLSPEPELTRALLDNKVIAIAYETVEGPNYSLPLLVPMSEIAGRLSIQSGALCLQQNRGGKGILLGGVPGVLPGKVTIVGGGNVGIEAARMALGLGADVTLLDRHVDRLRHLDHLFGPRLKTCFSSYEALMSLIPQSDLVIGAVLVPGKLAPKIISREMVKKMEAGSVIVDVSIDQGGCAETSRPTSHDVPTYLEEGVIHYCVTNMPGACARTSTEALTNATAYYALQIANLGFREAIKKVAGLAAGVNVCLGRVTHPQVAADLNYEYFPL